MAGYSGTPLPQKLGIKAGARLGLFDAPEGFDATLGALFAALAKAVAPAGSLWISWPKKSSGKKTDLDENVVRAVGLAKGLVDVKVCAVDETWSGLKFVVRLKDRPK